LKPRLPRLPRSSYSSQPYRARSQSPRKRTASDDHDLRTLAKDIGVARSGKSQDRSYPSELSLKELCRKANLELEAKLTESASKPVHDKLINHIKELREQLEYYKGNQMVDNAGQPEDGDGAMFASKRTATSIMIAQDKVKHARQGRESAILREAQKILNISAGQFLTSLHRIQKVMPYFAGCKRFVEECPI